MTRVVHWALITLVALGVAGCGLLYTNIRVPRAYRSATTSDVKANPADPIVSGETCYHAVLYLVAWGDASYATAAKRALAGDVNATLYDVKADAKGITVLLGLYSRVCTVVTGKVGHP